MTLEEVNNWLVKRIEIESEELSIKSLKCDYQKFFEFYKDKKDLLAWQWLLGWLGCCPYKNKYERFISNSKLEDLVIDCLELEEKAENKGITYWYGEKYRNYIWTEINYKNCLRHGDYKVFGTWSSLTPNSYYTFDYVLSKHEIYIDGKLSEKIL